MRQTGFTRARLQTETLTKGRSDKNLSTHYRSLPTFAAEQLSGFRSKLIRQKNFGHGQNHPKFDQYSNGTEPSQPPLAFRSGFCKNRFLEKTVHIAAGL